MSTPAVTDFGTEALKVIEGPRTQVRAGRRRRDGADSPAARAASTTARTRLGPDPSGGQGPDRALRAQQCGPSPGEARARTVSRHAGFPASYEACAWRVSAAAPDLKPPEHVGTRTEHSRLPRGGVGAQAMPAAACSAGAAGGPVLRPAPLRTPTPGCFPGRPTPGWPPVITAGVRERSRPATMSWVRVAAEKGEPSGHRSGGYCGKTGCGKTGFWREQRVRVA